jgi:hypothetical protein
VGWGPEEAYGASVDARVKGRPFFSAMWVNVRQSEHGQQASWENRQEFGNRVKYMTHKFDLGLFAGAIMEKVDEQMRMVAEEIGESKKVLQAAYNELTAVSTQLTPLFREQITGIRTARMSVVSEIQSSLVALKDIRKFFLDSDYEKEMKRLSEFITLCKELKKMKDDGTLDVLCDAALKLAVKE